MAASLSPQGQTKGNVPLGHEASTPWFTLSS